MIIFFLIFPPPSCVPPGTGQSAFFGGKLKIKGNMALAMKLNVLSAEQAKL